MNSSSFGLWVVLGLAAGIASTACTDQSTTEVNKAEESETSGEMQSDSHERSTDQASAPVAAEPKTMSAEETRELQQWFDEKLREAQDNEEISAEKRKEYEGWFDEKLRETQAH